MLHFVVLITCSVPIHVWIRIKYINNNKYHMCILYVYLCNIYIYVCVYLYMIVGVSARACVFFTHTLKFAT